MKQPPPLPPGLPTTTPADPPPLAYATPVHPRDVPPVFDWRMFGWTAAILGVWVAIMLFAVPKIAETFMDFKVRLTFGTRVMLQLGRALRGGAWVIMPVIPVGLGFLAAHLSPGWRRVLRTELTLAFAALIVISILTLLLPLMTLMDGMTSGR